MGPCRVRRLVGRSRSARAGPSFFKHPWRGDAATSLALRQNFVNELEDAAKLGRLALFVELVNHQRREVRDSKSVQDAESFAFLQSSGAQNYTAPRVDTLRDTILAEASLKADWLKSALVGPYRSNLFADSAILSLIGGGLATTAKPDHSVRLRLRRSVSRSA